ncbi:MAG: prepilin-type N-terminal cleavage/methylation domain-containing protein [Candidatus Omnitrophica bacterium]|nr:prepilin-type N-terminal cleavage/methylation domain-containing protein [Candidatus Omnitrophota bacterium]
MKLRKGFTIMEIIMVMVILGILATIAIPRFINMRREAQNAAADANLGALRSAASIYYSTTAIEDYNYLCTAAANSYRDVDVEAPCFPADIDELESLLTSPPEWNGATGQCYDSETGAIVACN